MSRRRIDNGSIAFIPPAELRDASVHRYQRSGARGEESIAIDYPRIESPVTAVAFLAALRSEALDEAHLVGAAIVSDEVVDVMLGGAPGVMLRIESRRGQACTSLAIAIAEIGPNALLRVTVQTTRAEADSETHAPALLTGVLASLVPLVPPRGLEQAWPEAPTGWVRRLAGAYAVAVPAELSPPLSFQFLGENPRVRIGVRLAFASRTAPTPDWQLHVMSKETLSNMTRDTECSVLEATLPMRGGRQVLLFASAERGHEDELATLWSELQSSLALAYEARV